MKKSGRSLFPAMPLTFIALLPILLLIVSLVTSCNQQEPPAAVAPSAASRSLKIGMVPEQDVFAQKKQYEPLMAYLSGELRTPVEFMMLSRYGNVLDNFHALGLDGAFLGSITGALAIENLGLEPVARPQYLDGSSTYYGMIFVKKGSGLRKADDLRGKRLVLVDKATTAGYLLPLAYFKSLGIADYRTWFKEYYFSGNHEDAIRDVMRGDADIGAAKNTIFYQMANSDPRILQELEILAVSPHVPANGLLVRPDLPDNLKRVLKQKLLTMHEQEAGRRILGKMQLTRFVETMGQDYQPVIDYAASLGLNLKTYDLNH